MQPWNRQGMYNKLSVWRLDEDFDLVLFLDADGYAVGRVEDAIDEFEKAAQEYFEKTGVYAILGAVKDASSPFNAGMMVLHPRKSTFQHMLAAGAKTITDYPPAFAEQAFLSEFMGGTKPKARWVALPQIYNLKVKIQEYDKEGYDEVFRKVQFLHYANRIPRVMEDRINFTDKGKEVESTSDGWRKDTLDVLWNDAWRETRRLLEMPMDT